MDQDMKKLLTENSLKRVHELFINSDDSSVKFAKAISEVSVKSAIIVLEEYEKLKNSQ